jgi:Glycosyltransferase family 87
MRNAIERLCLVLVGLVFIASAVQGGLQVVSSHGSQRDFRVYFTASSMIRNHEGSHIYDQAADGADPQLQWADPNTLFAEHARKLGLDEVKLYVYPPLLADMLVPLAFLRLASAEHAWLVLNAIFVLAATLIMARMFSPNRVRWFWPPLFVAVLLFRPTLDCFFLGQISILLLLLQAAGLYFYFESRTVPAALMFAIITAIKITPLIVIVPLLAFRDWKQLRAFVLALAALLIGICFVNGEGLLRQYVEHVVPSMSAGVVSLQNRNLGTALQIAWQRTDQLPALRSISLLGKLLSLAVICYAGWLSRFTPKSDFARKTAVLMLFFLLGCCLAPVAWRHSYVLAAPALAVLVGRAWKGRMNAVEFIALCCFLPLVLGLGFTQWASDTGNPLLLDAAMLGPVAGIALTLALLYGRLRASLPLDEESLL